MSDSLVDLSAKLDMTIDWVASDYSGGSYLLFVLCEVGLFVRFISLKRKDLHIVISTGAVAEWRNLSDLYVIVKR